MDRRHTADSQNCSTSSALLHMRQDGELHSLCAANSARSRLIFVRLAAKCVSSIPLR